MSAARCFALSTVVALCAAATAPLVAADSDRSLPGPQLASKTAFVRLVSQTHAQPDPKTAALSRSETRFASLRTGRHPRVTASAVAAQQFTTKLDPRTCSDPTENCNPWSLVSIGRRIAKYPEPAALSLFGTSLLGIAGVTRRRFFR